MSFTFHSVLIGIQLSPENTGFLSSGRRFLSHMLLPLKHGVGQTSFLSFIATFSLFPTFLSCCILNFIIIRLPPTVPSLLQSASEPPIKIPATLSSLQLDSDVHFLRVFGDLNIHLDDPSNILILYFLDLLSSSDLFKYPTLTTGIFFFLVSSSSTLTPAILWSYLDMQSTNSTSFNCLLSAPSLGPQFHPHYFKSQGQSL